MFALLALLAGYNVWARKVLVRRMLAAPREPGTDILLGGGPVLIERGRERACLLVHGFMGTPADFGELPAALDESGWDVHAPLLPGHGTDPRRLAAVSAEETIAAVARHLTALRGRYRDGLVLVNPYFRSRYLARYVLPPRWWHRILSPFVGYVVRPRWMINVRRREAWPRIVCYRVIPARAFAEVFAIADRARQCAAPGARRTGPRRPGRRASSTGGSRPPPRGSSSSRGPTTCCSGTTTARKPSGPSWSS